MDRYERVDKLGEGGQGKVYKVRRREDGRIVVLKMINCADPTFSQLAEREIEIMRSCSHKHIIHFEESFRHEGKSGTWVCLVMEYCAGGDLFNKFRIAVQERRRFPEAELRQWIVQAASGLQYMHDRDLWHRDIKAANMLFGEDGVLKLGDFGLSTKYSPQGHKTVVGTPFYFAPEIMLGQEYSCKVDIWNLGVVMLELITFKQAPVNCEVLQDEKKPERLMHDIVRDGYSKKLALLVSSMLRRHPEERPSAREVLQQLEESGASLDGRNFAESETALRDALAQMPGFGRPHVPRRAAPPRVQVQRVDSSPGQQCDQPFNSPRTRQAQGKRSHTPTERAGQISPRQAAAPPGVSPLVPAAGEPPHPAAAAAAPVAAAAAAPAAAAAAGPAAPGAAPAGSLGGTPVAGFAAGSFGMRGTVRQLASHYDAHAPPGQQGAALHLPPAGPPVVPRPAPPEQHLPQQGAGSPPQPSHQMPRAATGPPHLGAAAGGPPPPAAAPGSWNAGAAGGAQVSPPGSLRPNRPSGQLHSPQGMGSPGVASLGASYGAQPAQPWQSPQSPAAAAPPQPGGGSPPPRAPREMRSPATPLGTLQGADAALRAAPQPQRAPNAGQLSPRGFGDSEIQQLQNQLQRLQQQQQQQQRRDP